MTEQRVASFEETIRRAWRRPDGCLAIDRLAILAGAGALEPEEGSHLESCPRCSAEAALAGAFTEPASGAELVAVEEVVAVARGRRGAPASGAGSSKTASRSWLRWQLAAAAVIVALLGTTPSLRSPAPPLLPAPPDTSVVRGVGLVIVSPTGALGAAPRSISFAPLPEVVRYRVRLSRLDGSTVTEAEGPASPLPLAPPEPGLLPGVHYELTLEGLDAEGRVVASASPAEIWLQRTR